MNPLNRRLSRPASRSLNRDMLARVQRVARRSHAVTDDPAYLRARWDFAAFCPS